MIELKRIGLSTGITLNLALAGERASPAIILLHGFPESHRTWRELVPRLKDNFFLVMPDQRGFAGSDLPQDSEAYRTDILIDDIFALADALDLEDFALLGHDWGGAIAWGAALRRDRRLRRLAIVNSPHPLIFQRSLFESAEQRSASQYISAFRAPGFDKMVEAKGFDWFFDTTFARHVDLSKVSPAERRHYIADWSRPGVFNAMLNWYRASKLIVPQQDIAASAPEWLANPFPKVTVPTLVLWGMEDKALLPLQLEGLDKYIDQLWIKRLPGVGHFAPWEAPDDLVPALGAFLAGQAEATAPAR